MTGAAHQTTANTKAGPQRQLSAAGVIRRRLDVQIALRGRIVIIGLGGIGLYLARAVVTFLAGLLQDLRTVESDATIEVLLVDGDSFSEENTYRMEIPDFGNKAEVIGAEMLERINCPGLIVRWVTEFVDTKNISQIVREGDCVLLACDNHKTRHIVGRHCAKRNDVVLISGGNDGIEGGLRGSYGNIQIGVRKQGTDLTAPIDKFHPEIANPTDESPAEKSCLELEVAGAPQLSFANLAVASAMCNALLRLMMPVEGERMYDEVALDILDAVTLPHWLSGPQQLAPDR